MAAGGVGYWFTGYWSLGYWHLGYWAETASIRRGTPIDPCDYPVGNEIAPSFDVFNEAAPAFDAQNEVP